MPLYLTLEAGESVRIGADTIVRVEKKSGSMVKLSIDSEYKIRVERGDRVDRPPRPNGAKPSLDKPPRT